MLNSLSVVEDWKLQLRGSLFPKKANLGGFRTQGFLSSYCILLEVGSSRLKNHSCETASSILIKLFILPHLQKYISQNNVSEKSLSDLNDILQSNAFTSDSVVETCSHLPKCGLCKKIIRGKSKMKQCLQCKTSLHTSCVSLHMRVCFVQ